MKKNKHFSVLICFLVITSIVLGCILALASKEGCPIVQKGRGKLCKFLKNEC